MGMMSGNNPLQGMTQEDLMRLLAMIQMQKQQGMMQQPMMLAAKGANAMSPQELLEYCKADPNGVGCENFRPPAPVNTPVPYSQGKDSPSIIDFKKRQMESPINRNDALWKMLRSNDQKAPDAVIDYRYQKMNEKNRQQQP